MDLRTTLGERVFSLTNGALLLIVALAALYPIAHIAFGSISDPVFMNTHQGVILWPHGFNMRAYEIVLKNPNIRTGYTNTIIVVVAGTCINLFMSALGAYCLSRKRFAITKLMMIMVIITMYFSGGMIPRYLIFRNIYHIDDTLWALVLPGAISTWNLIIMRTSFQSLPDGLEESAYIDGANDIVILARIVIPLSMAVMAVMALFYGVAHWNAWFDAMIFLRKRELYPLQLILREMLISQKQVATGGDEIELLAENLKYATIIVATLPILTVYPFIQRYFVKGVMVGALKG